VSEASVYRLLKALDLALGHRVIGRSPNVIHVLVSGVSAYETDLAD
jgi:hypothetical protein